MRNRRLNAWRLFPFALLLSLTGIFFAGRAAADDWPRAHSDIPAYPSVVFGKLPNGLRYAIMHNATPKGVVSMRLCIGAGSIEESGAQQGLAHFLEHMAFRGSRHVPENEVWSLLQRLGLAFGADANASTGSKSSKPSSRRVFLISFASRAARPTHRSTCSYLRSLSPASAISSPRPNDWGLESLTAAQADARLLDMIPRELPDLKRVTAADVQHSAQTYLIDAKASKAEIVPKPPVAIVHAGSLRLTEPISPRP